MALRVLTHVTIYSQINPSAQNPPIVTVNQPKAKLSSL